MEAARWGAVAAKSSSNAERGDTESESKRERAAGESASRLAEAGDAATSSGSKANLRFGLPALTGRLRCLVTVALTPTAKSIGTHYAAGCKAEWFRMVLISSQALSCQPEEFIGRAKGTE
ncbi:unnamed protein product, partial [Iphiclides podalirius]